MPLAPLVGLVLTTLIVIVGLRVHDNALESSYARISARASGIASTAAHCLSAQPWIVAGEVLPEQTDLTTWDHAPREIDTARDVLGGIARANELWDGLQTLHLKEAYRDRIAMMPDRIWPDALEVWLDTARSPSWRESSDYHPVMRRALYEGRVVHHKERSGDGTDTVLSHAPIRDENDHIVGFVRCVLDFEESRAAAFVKAEELVLGLLVGLLVSALVSIRVHRVTSLARHAAQRSAEARTRFLANTNHELRTPIAGILGMVDELAPRLEEREDRERLEILKQCAARLNGLVADMLDVSHHNAEDIAIHPSPILLGAWLETVVQAQRGEGERKGLDVRVEPGEDAHRSLLLDGTVMGRVVGHLLGNAIRFTTTGTVTVTARVREAELHLEVTDTGVGIAPEDIERVRRPWEQAASASTRVQAGTGIGLATAQLLLEALKGRLEITSQLGRGSSFIAIVPVTVLDASEVACRLPGAHGVAQAQAASTTGGEEVATANDLRPLRILVAEDNPVNARVARRTLESAGHEVHHAEDGEQAVQAWQADAGFDLILMDLQMPVLDGYDAASRIRAGESGTGSHIPICALTADGATESRQRCADVGMDAFLGKPYTREMLLETVLGLSSESPVASAPDSRTS